MPERHSAEKKSPALNLHVVEVQVAHSSGRHGPGLRRSPEWRAYREAGAYGIAGDDTTFAQPTLEESELTDDPVADLAVIGGRIADAAAEGAAAGKQLLMVGGNCTSVPGMIGGLQRVWGPAARIGLVWLDAHGDLNTPRTTVNGILGGMPAALVAALSTAVWPHSA